MPSTRTTFHHDHAAIAPKTNMAEGTSLKLPVSQGKTAHTVKSSALPSGRKSSLWLWRRTSSHSAGVRSRKFRWMPSLPGWSTGETHSAAWAMWVALFFSVEIELKR